METGTPILRTLRREDIPEALRLKEFALWNQVAADWALFIDLVPEGAFALEKGGALIATATAVPYGRSFGWVGMMLVHPEERRKGHGARMLDAAVSFLLHRGCLPALDATAQGKPLYERSGFRDLYTVERWTGPVPPDLAPDRRCRKLEPAGIEEVLPLDQESFGEDRRAVLEGLLLREGSIGFCLGGAGGIEGYIAGRPGSRFYHLGPWVSQSPEAAARLLATALHAVPGGPVCVDIPVPNEAARALARRAGLEPIRELWRMVRAGEAPRLSAGGIPPGGRPDRIFGLAGLEWG